MTIAALLLLQRWKLVGSAKSARVIYPDVVDRNFVRVPIHRMIYNLIIIVLLYIIIIIIIL